MANQGITGEPAMNRMQVPPPPGLGAPDPSRAQSSASAVFEALARLQAERASQALDAAILAAHMSAATGPAATAPRMPSLAQGERGERGERREESGKWNETWSQASTASASPRGAEDKMFVQHAVRDEAQLRKHSGRPSRPSGRPWAAGPRGCQPFDASRRLSPGQPAYVVPQLRSAVPGSAPVVPTIDVSSMAQML
mmetsp:Transcript_71365/g.117317  ORF Transcript_71365/g.117317 Transcript_71365/m.117317 type:complete len:197 (-) Transcript_71365:75-665(-)